MIDANPAAGATAAPSRKPLGCAARLLLMAVSALVGLSVLEFTVDTLDVAPPRRGSILVWSNERDQALSDRGSAYRPHPRWLWEPRPGDDEFGSTINDLGYRGTEYPQERSASTLRICTLGDSSTYGFGMVEMMSWSRQLEQILVAYGYDVEVLNFGCTGYSLYQGVELYLGRVRDYRPDIVIASFGAVNDSVPPPSDLTDRTKAVALSAPSYRLRMFLRRYEAFRYLELLVGVSPGVAANLGDRTMQRVPPVEFAGLLARLDDAVRADGASLVLVSPPRRRDFEQRTAKLMEYTDTIERVASERGVPLARVRELFRDMEAEELGGDVDLPHVASTTRLFIDNVHPSDVGHRSYAVCVGQTLKEAGLLPASPEDGR